MAPLLDGASHRSQFSILESAGTTPDDCYTIAGRWCASRAEFLNSV
jgi:hypothetical protein